MVVSTTVPGLVLSPEVVIAQAQQAFLAPARFAEYVTQATGVIMDASLPQQLLLELYLEDVLNYLKASIVQEVFSGSEEVYAISASTYDRFELRVVSNDCFINFVRVPKDVAFGEDVALKLMYDALPPYPNLEGSGRFDLQKSVCSAIVNALLSSKFLRSLDESTLTAGQRKLLPDAEKAVFYWYEALADTFN